MLQNTWLCLLIAIVMEVIGTSFLTASHGMSVKSMAVAAIISYIVTFYFMSITLKYLPAGVVYAVWSGAGIVLISLIGFLWFHQKLDKAALVGIALILAGVLTINLFSTSSS